MVEAYWTHCMYCGEMICGGEILEDYPDVVVLYAHRDCHERHTHAQSIAIRLRAYPIPRLVWCAPLVVWQ